MSRGRGEAERGSVAITVALSLTVLLGFAALVVDIGLNWATRTSAQTAADSAALAGASSLLSDGGLAAITTVEDFLNRNVGGLVELPDDAGWATDGNVGNGEVVCWTMPNPVPGPGAACPDGSNALQVTTPPIVVRYAFASVLGKTTSSIRARAAAGAGPAAPNNCVLCVLDPDDDGGAGGDRPRRDRRRRRRDRGQLRRLRRGGAGQRRGHRRQPDQGRRRGRRHRASGSSPAGRAGRAAGSRPARRPAHAGRADPAAHPGGDPGPEHHRPRHPHARHLRQHQRERRRRPDPGGRGLRGHRARRVPGQERRPGAEQGDGATIYLACSDYPAPCDNELGARFRLDDGGQFLASPPASGEYAGLSIFADRGNTRSTLLFGDVDLAGAVYTASSRLRVFSTSGVQIDSLLVVDRLQSINLDTLEVNYDPSDPLPGVGVPVLIQ